MTVTRHVCAQTHLICAKTWLCPDILVPQHKLLWPDVIMSLVNNNIIILSTRLIMCQLDWWKHKHAQLFLGIEMWLFNYCTTITSSIPTRIFRYFIITCQGTKYVSGLWAQTYTFLPRHDCDHTIITCRAQTYVGTNVSGHKRVWAQTCLGTNYVGTNMCGHNLVGSSMCGYKCVVAIPWKHVNLKILQLKSSG